MPVDAIAVLVEKLTLITVLAWGVIAFARGWVVPTAAHKEVLDAITRDRDAWREYAGTVNAALEKLTDMVRLTMGPRG